MNSISSPTIQQLSLYMGCQTNVGELVGIVENTLYTKLPGKSIEKHDIGKLGSIKLLLKKLNTLSEEESNLLIKKGFSIGRPNGYSFSPESILYLTSLSVDLFGLIESGYAEEITGSK